MTHFFMVPFTGLGLNNGFRGNHWLKNRIKVFNEFVLPSLLNQAGEFKVWFCWRKEEESNPIVRDFMDSLGDTRLSVIHTFHGIPFYDDKYEDSEAKERLLSTLKGSLPELKKHVEGDWVLVTIQPSDDCYVGTTALQVQETLKDKEGAAGYRKGWICNYSNKEIAEYMCQGWATDETSSYRTDTIPPFFTISYKKDVFLDPEKHFNFIGPYKSHEYIADVMSFVELEGRGFLVGCHGENISTTYNVRYKGRVLTNKEAEEVMDEVGIFYSKPLVVNLSARVKVRKVLNSLPFRNVLKYIYNLLPAQFRKL